MPALKQVRSTSGCIVVFLTAPWHSMPRRQNAVNGLRQKRSTDGCATSLAILPPLSRASGKRIGRSSGLARSHPHALHGLEELAFGLDAGGNDDFGFLELANVSGTDIAHASGDSASQVLGSIIDRR